MIKYKHIYIEFFCFYTMFKHSSYFSNEQIVDFRRFIAENKQNTELITSRLMLAMGFKLHLCGAKYLREAIDYCYKLPKNAKVSFSGTVYLQIAQKFNSSARNVDRDIRTAIQCCYQSGNMLIFNDICGYNIISRQYPPTNSEFITNVVEFLRTVNP